MHFSEAVLFVVQASSACSVVRATFKVRRCILSFCISEIRLICRHLPNLFAAWQPCAHSGHMAQPRSFCGAPHTVLRHELAGRVLVSHTVPQKHSRRCVAAQAGAGGPVTKKVFFDIEQDKKSLGRIVVGLYGICLPKRASVVCFSVSIAQNERHVLCYVH